MPKYLINELRKTRHKIFLTDFTFYFCSKQQVFRNNTYICDTLQNSFVGKDGPTNDGKTGRQTVVTLISSCNVLDRYSGSIIYF